jgi:hypothetical protein
MIIPINKVKKIWDDSEISKRNNIKRLEIIEKYKTFIGYPKNIYYWNNRFDFLFWTLWNMIERKNKKSLEN